MRVLPLSLILLAVLPLGAALGTTPSSPAPGPEADAHGAARSAWVETPGLCIYETPTPPFFEITWCH